MRLGGNRSSLWNEQIWDDRSFVLRYRILLLTYRTLCDILTFLLDPRLCGHSSGHASLTGQQRCPSLAFWSCPVFGQTDTSSSALVRCRGQSYRSRVASCPSAARILCPRCIWLRFSFRSEEQCSDAQAISELNSVCSILLCSREEWEGREK